MDILQQPDSSKKKSRRPGTGSIKALSKGTYLVRYSVPSANGERKQVNITVKGSQKYAEQMLRDRLKELDNNNHVSKSKATVNKLMDDFLEFRCIAPPHGKVRLRTKHGYEGQIKRYVEPEIGGSPYQSLTSLDIDKLYAWMISRGLSGTTVFHLRRLLKSVFHWAVQKEYIHKDRNRVDAPESDKREVAIWELSDIHRFLEICDNSRYVDFFRLSIDTGLRRSEAAGLKRESVDLVQGTLRVENVLHHLAGHGLKNDIPKTDGSNPVQVQVPSSAPTNLDMN